jgi:glycosyltransferase involved in cell wall biosynthesis
MAPRTSLIITTYNWKAALALCLRSVAAQRVLPDDVIVADDGSREDTAQLVQELARDFPVPLRHAWQEDLGFRAARVRNLGIAASTGDYVIFVDGDMVLHPEFIADHHRLIRPGSFLLGGRLNASQAESARLLDGGAPRFSMRMPFAPRGAGGELKRKHAFRLPLLAAWKASRRKGGVAMSCNLGVWRHDLDTINGFDDAYEGWGREDDDLTLRLRHAGVERRLLRYAGLAIHLWHKTRWPDGIPPNQALPNDVLLQRTRDTRAIRCVRGLDAHVAAAQAMS